MSETLFDGFEKNVFAGYEKIVHYEKLYKLNVKNAHRTKSNAAKNIYCSKKILYI